MLSSGAADAKGPQHRSTESTLTSTAHPQTRNSETGDSLFVSGPWFNTIPTETRYLLKHEFYIYFIFFWCSDDSFAWLLPRGAQLLQGIGLSTTTQSTYIYIVFKSVDGWLYCFIYVLISFETLCKFSEYRQQWWFPGQTPHVCISLVPRPLGRPGFWGMSPTRARRKMQLFTVVDRQL